MCQCWQAELLTRVDLLRTENPDIYFEMSWHAGTGWNCYLVECIHGTRHILVHGHDLKQDVATRDILDFLRRLETHQ